MIVFQISDYYKDLDTLAIFIIRVVLVQCFVRLYQCKKYNLEIESSLCTSTYIFIIKLPLFCDKFNCNCLYYLLVLCILLINHVYSSLAEFTKGKNIHYGIKLMVTSLLVGNLKQKHDGALYLTLTHIN